jgi:hypothetical protein
MIPAINKLPYILKIPKEIFKSPNSVSLYHGRDQKNSFIRGKTGSDIFTSHVEQKFDWDSVSFDYRWNNLGLRGPNPDYEAENKILFLGGSLSLGTGIPEDLNFVHLISESLNASYINLSDADSISQLIEPIIQLSIFSPNYIIINDTRFIQHVEWIYMLMRDTVLDDISIKKSVKEIIADNNKSYIVMVDYFLKQLFPKALIIYAICDKRPWNKIVSAIPNCILLTKDLVVDLARDNAHPGIKSHKNFSIKILNFINNAKTN